MARLFLQIGAHKTGTSYLQGLFHRNRARLAECGLHYPRIGPNEAHHALASSWIKNSDIPDRFFGKGGPDGFWQTRIIEPYATAPGTVFLSAENFSRFLPEKVDMAALARRLEPFDEVRLFYTLRRQTELVSSLWTQVAKQRRTRTLRQYVKRAYTECLGGGIPLDHGAVYDHLLTGFAPEQITLLDYASISRAPGGMAQVFLDLMEIDLRADTLAPPPRSAANVSPDPLALYVACQINGGDAPPKALVEKMRTIVHPDPMQPATLLARHEYARVRKRFAPLNAALVQRVQAVQPGFTFEDPPPPENLLYRDDLDSETWARVATGLYHPSKLQMAGTAALNLLRQLRHAIKYR